MARKKFTLQAALGLVAVLVVLCFTLLPGAPPLRPLPNPNGYDDFVKAANVSQSTYSDKWMQPELAAYVTFGAEALRLARVGMTKDCRVDLQSFAGSFPQGYIELDAWKGLEMLFLAEGRLALLEGRTNDAVNAYLDGIHFAQEFSRGGLLVSRITSIDCEVMISKQLTPLADGLSATNCRTIATALETLDTKEESIQETLHQEAAWTRKQYGIRGQIEKLFTYKQDKSSRDKIIAKDQSRARQRRRLMIAAAARAYQSDTGKRPQRAADLVPEYLRAVPKDPATGKDLSLGP